MNYLTVPAMSSVPQMEKMMPEQGQGQGAGAGVPGTAFSGLGPGNLPSPHPEPSMVLAVSSMSPFMRGSRRYSSKSSRRSRQGSKTMEKLLPTQEQGQAQGAGAGVPGTPYSGLGPGYLPSPHPDPSTVLAVSSVSHALGGSRHHRRRFSNHHALSNSTIQALVAGDNLMRSEKLGEGNGCLLCPHPQTILPPSLTLAKPTRHHRKRKHRRMTLKEMVVYAWQKIHPHLVLLRKIIYDLTQSFIFDFIICSVVALNTLLLVAQTFAVVEIRGEWFFAAMDPAFLSVYVLEAILKLIALGCDYFHDPWNDIDFFIMCMTVLDFLLPLLIRTGNRSNTLTLFRVLKICKAVRAIRAIRFLLTLRVMENLQEVTSTFMLSCQSIGAIILLMFSFLFMSSVVLRDMFQEADEKHFGDLFNTIFTLFQLFTLDDWSLIYLTCQAAGSWYIIIFLIIYILVEYFFLLNLVIAVLVDNFQMALVKRQELKRQKKWVELKESSVAEDAFVKVADKPQAKEEKEEELFRKTVMGKYGSLELMDREWEYLYFYFRLMTAIETNQQQFQSQAATTDKILDTFFETAEHDYLSK
ncbi:cation channel sperm-associated protein 1 [Lacerta agilis]|uniref:cation channel sperm-associated protein 1 n=1 Tax=Lacerta agilis TaxID=80427 RepID=UPI0014196CCE|nr:cation channel sperm-associated protein 1 [Lacerta agilis]